MQIYKKICILLFFIISSINIINAEKQKVVLINNYNKQKEKNLEINEILTISGINIIYKGEKEIYYRINNDKLYIDGKLVGIEINHSSDFEMIEDDTKYFNIDKLVDLSPLKENKNPIYLFLKYGSYDNEYLKTLSEISNLYLFSQYSSKITDQTLSYMTNLKKLEYLIIKDANITNEGMKNLKNLGNLKYVNLYSTNITDDGGLINIKNKKIYYLNLNSTKINDEALKHIRDMKDLKKLHLRGTKITDQGLEYLSNLKKLEELDISATKISNDGLKYLSKLQNIKILNLSDTKISGEGLQYLKYLKGLKEINLEDTKIDDAGIKYLLNFSNLTKLDLEDTNITNNSIPILEKLKKLNYLNIKYTNITFNKKEYSTDETIEDFFKKAKDINKTYELKMEAVLYKTYNINSEKITKLKPGTKFKILNYYENNIDNIYITNNKISTNLNGNSIKIPNGKECIVIGFNDKELDIVLDVNRKKTIIQIDKKLITRVKGYSKISTEDGQKGWIISNYLE